MQEQTDNFFKIELKSGRIGEQLKGESVTWKTNYSFLLTDAQGFRADWCPGLVRTCLPAQRAGRLSDRWSAWRQSPWKEVVLATLTPPLHPPRPCPLSARAQSRPRRSQLCCDLVQPSLMRRQEDLRTFSPGKPDTRGRGSQPHCRHGSTRGHRHADETTDKQPSIRAGRERERGWKEISWAAECTGGNC